MKWSRTSIPKSPSDSTNPPQQSPDPQSLVRRQPLIEIPGCKVHLMNGGDATEIAYGDLTILRISDNNLSLATTIKVGNTLHWPLTKDEPVVKLDEYHYLFTIPMSDGDPLSYGVSFSDRISTERLACLDSFLKENCCFSTAGSGKMISGKIDWKDFAPSIEDYNGVLARAIANGTGQIIRGIFICSNAYTSMVHKGAENILTRVKEEKLNGHGSRSRERRLNRENKSKGAGGKNNSVLNKSLKRVRKLSNMTEKMSKAMLDAIGMASGSLMGPLVRTKTGQAFFSMMPGEVLLASLDAVDKFFNAAEAAEKQTLKATSEASVMVVSEKYGDGAGEATGHALATAGNVAGTAWNVFMIRKALKPSSSASAGILKSSQKSVNHGAIKSG